MQSWHNTYLGLHELPRDISTFELQTFFTYRGSERKLIEARRGNALKLGLALHIGFLRLSGRLLNSVRLVPSALWRHLGQELGVTAPELASLKALYGRGRTLFDHQQLACEVLQFRWMTEYQRRALVRVLRYEVARRADRDQLLVFARRWLYQNKILIPRDRDIRALVTAALIQLEEETAKAITTAVPMELLSRWRSAMRALRPDGQTQQSWLWAAPAKHSTKQIAEVFERIEFLYAGIATAGLNELALRTAVGEKRLQLEGAYVAWQLMQAKVSVVPALHLVSPVIGADTIPAKKVNRKANGIKGLANYPYVSASFPTVTFGNKNKTTPHSPVSGNR